MNAIMQMINNLMNLLPEGKRASVNYGFSMDIKFKMFLFRSYSLSWGGEGEGLLSRQGVWVMNG